MQDINERGKGGRWKRDDRDKGSSMPLDGFRHMSRFEKIQLSYAISRQTPSKVRFI